LNLQRETKKAQAQLQKSEVAKTTGNLKKYVAPAKIVE